MRQPTDPVSVMAALPGQGLGRASGCGFAVLVVAAALLAGCETQPTREQGAMVVGGLLGGALGAQMGEGSGRTAATIVGSLIGAAIGGAVGRSMAETDRLKTAHALETVRTGVPSRWTNPDTGNRYLVTPTRTFELAAGPCREFTLEAQVGGRDERVYGTACRQQDGSWRVAP